MSSPAKENSTWPWHGAGWQSFTAAALVVALYFDVLPGWVQTWWADDGYSHGLLVAPLALYLVWRQRASLLEEPAAPSYKGLFVVFSACLAYLMGRLGAEFFLTRISLVLLVTGLVWTFRGLPALRRVAFPLLLLTSVVPLPVIVFNSLSAPLQLLASGVATEVTQWLGISAYREGNTIQLAQTSLGVAEACSGLRSLASLSVAALLLGYLECSRFRTRALVFLMAIPIAVSFNVLRVAGTALLAEHNPDLAMGFYHSITGWLVFVGGFGVLYAASKLLRLLFDGKRELYT